MVDWCVANGVGILNPSHCFYNNLDPDQDLFLPPASLKNITALHTFTHLSSWILLLFVVSELLLLLCFHHCNPTFPDHSR